MSRLMGRPMMLGNPAVLSFEPTTSCNLRCPECPSGLRSFSRPTGMLQMSHYQQVIRESAKHLTFLHLYFQGEPYLNPYFLDMVAYANKLKIYTSSSTNAHYLTQENIQKTIDSGLRHLIVSVDGTTQDTYETYRIGGNFEKVKNGVSELIRIRDQHGAVFPQVILQFLVTGKNEHQIPAIKNLAKAWKVDGLELKTAQIYGYENGSDLIPENLRYSRYKHVENGKWALKRKISNRCWRMWKGAVVTWDGKMVPCCFDKDASHEMGNLRHSRLMDIWRNETYQQFRTQLLKDRSQIEICKNCTE